MYYYIVDPQKISQRQFERVQNNLYSSLSEYRISGETARVTGLRTITQLVEGAFARGVRTLVAVGTDETLHEVINAIKGRDMTVGFVPLIQTELSEILGLPNIEQAAKTIGLRRIAELDMLQVNEQNVISKITFGAGTMSTGGGLFNFPAIQNLWDLPVFQIKFSADNQNFEGTISAVAGMIVNSRKGEGAGAMFNPTDGVLDLLLLPKLNKISALKYYKQIVRGEYEKIPGSSVIHARQLELSIPAGLQLKAGDRVIARTPAKIVVLPKALKIIVGRDRKF